MLIKSASFFLNIDIVSVAYVFLVLLYYLSSIRIAVYGETDLI
jgi:hypothetical protein